VVKQTFEMMADEDLPGPAARAGGHARKALKDGYVKPTKRVFDNTKVSDHFAIIPTLQAPKSLTEIEAKLYDMVVKRFLAVFYPPAEFMVTTRISKVELAGCRRTTSRPTARCWSTPAGWRCTARKRRTRTPTWWPWQPGEMVRTEAWT
jgi:DNA topoisomerase-3